MRQESVERVVEHRVGDRVIVNAMPFVTGRVPRWGTVYQDYAEGLPAEGVRFRWYVWLDGDAHATGPYEDCELI